jgi:transposase InsO family protein
MREIGIVGVPRSRKAYRSKKKPETEPSLDLVRRDFVAEDINQIWCADITYVSTWEGMLFLAVVFDTFSRKIVGWSMDSTMEASLVDDALRMAIARRNPDPGLIHHSDKGGQYRSLLLGATMRAFGILPSMGAVASPADNAITESLMSNIKCECVHRTTFKTREVARIEIFDYIECFYNRLRLHSGIDYMSPDEYEAILEERKGAAA